MTESKENEMSTKSKINTLINDIQNKLNKRAGYRLNNPNRGNIDINTFQSFGPAGIPLNQEGLNSKEYKLNNHKTYFGINPKYNNYVKDINNNIPPISQPIITNEGNFPINEFHLRNIIKDEFTNLILPYQKDAVCNSNLMESKLNDIEKKFQIIINAQNMGNLNDNAKIISAYLCSNLSNDNLNKNIEKLKMEYDNLFDGLQKKIDSLSNQLSMQKMNNDSNISNIFKKMEILDKKLKEIDDKDVKIYVEQNIFDEAINKFNENQNKIKNDSENNIKNLNNQIENNLRNINNQIDNINKSLNQYKLDINNEINKINGLDNNLNSLRTDFGKITEDVSQVKYQITPDIIKKINSIDFNSLKQQISFNDFKNLKDNVNIFETNLNSIKTMVENSDKSIYDLKKLINNIEEKQNSSNKNIQNIQPLLNENILEKIKIINDKIEELSKIKNDNENKINNSNKNNNKDENKDDDKENNKEEKKEEEPGIFIGGSRRQQRNNKSVNNNSINKSANINLDQKSLDLIKQLENINLNELQKVDFNNILKDINNLNNENKNLLNKIDQQNKEISEINQKIKNLQNNTNNLVSNKNTLESNIYNLSKSEIKNDFKSNKLEFNDPYKREPKINDVYNKKMNEKDKDIFDNNKIDDNMIEDEYDDFDKDIDDNKNEFDFNKDKDKNKEINPLSLLDDKIKQNDLLSDKNNFESERFNKKSSKNDYGKFDKYAETNILDQIMGLGGSRRNNDFDKNFNSGGTFITGSLTASKKDNFIDKKPVFNDNNKINNKSKNEEIIDKNEKKEQKKDDDFNDDFDDFDAEEI